MEAACRGARSRRGRTLGLLPGRRSRAANGWVEVAIATGLGELRNGLVVRAADALVAVGGGLRDAVGDRAGAEAGRPVVGLGTWDVHGVEHVSTPEEALDDSRVTWCSDDTVLVQIGGHM